MDEFVLKKFKNEIKLTAAVLIISALLFAGILFIISTNLKMQAKIETQEVQLSRYVKFCGADAKQKIDKTELELSILKNQHKKLKDMLKGVKSKQDHRADPLYFKQRLFSVQDKIKIAARNNKAALPASLGFDGYELKLPDEGQVPLLMQELQMSEEVLTRLIENGISAVNKVELPHEKVLFEYKDTEVVKVDSCYMFVEVETSYNALKIFLNYLSGYDNPYILSQLSVKKDNPQGLSVNLGIRILKL